MADIAEAAGVSKGTPYLYFAGTEALFIALYGPGREHREPRSAHRLVTGRTA